MLKPQTPPQTRQASEISETSEASEAPQTIDLTQEIFNPPTGISLIEYADLYEDFNN